MLWKYVCGSVIQVVLLFFDGKIGVFSSWDNRYFNKKPMGRDGIDPQMFQDADLWAIYKWKGCKMGDRQLKSSLALMAGETGSNMSTSWPLQEDEIHQNT